MTARQVFYTGKVQGVGFRYAVKQIAAGFEVTGYVKNLPDGRVELCAMSRDPDELSAFLADIRENSSLRAHIREVEECVVPPLEGVTGFKIER